MGQRPCLYFSKTKDKKMSRMGVLAMSFYPRQICKLSYWDNHILYPCFYVITEFIKLSAKKFTLSLNRNHRHHHHHHHHVLPLAWISLTLSRHFSLSFIASGRSSGPHPVSSHSCWMYVRAGRPAFARPYMGVHRSTSLMSSSLLLQQCPACLATTIWLPASHHEN